jgi:hypothetical protein
VGSQYESENHRRTNGKPKKPESSKMRREAANTRERNLPIITPIKEIKLEHPFRGYRRIWAYLKYVDGLEINKKRVFRQFNKRLSPTQNTLNELRLFCSCQRQII